MSSVVISGDTSGAITLAAPAVAGTNTITLPANTGTVLTTASTFSGTGPAFSAYANAAQTISNGSFTKTTFSVEQFDTNNNFASSTFTPTVAGYYQITFNLKVNGTTQTRYIGSLYKNATAIGRQWDLAITVSAGISTYQTGSALVYMNGSTDYLEVYVYIEGTGTLTTGSTDVNTNYFSGVLVRGA